MVEEGPGEAARGSTGPPSAPCSVEQVHTLFSSSYFASCFQCLAPEFLIFVCVQIWSSLGFDCAVFLRNKHDEDADEVLAWEGS